MTNFKDLGDLGDRMKAAMVRQTNETGETKPMMSGAHLKEALLGDAADRQHEIDPRIISDFFVGLEELCSAIIEDNMFGYYPSKDGDMVPRETTDAHILIGRMVWSFEKQLEYHERTLLENTRRMKVCAERAACGEIDMQKLAQLERYGDVAEKSCDFWEHLIQDLKACHQNVAGRPYRHGKKNAPVDKAAAKSLVQSINEIVQRRESRRTSAAS